MSSTSDDMSFSPQRAKQLLDNFTAVAARVNAVNTAKRPVRIVLVSKLKPASDVLALHSSSSSSSSSNSPSTTETAPSSSSPTPQALHFGENYVQELTDKAARLPRSIRWHFIGGLQSNKCRGLAGIPNLWCVSSVDSAKKADLLDKGRAELLAAAADGTADGDAAREGEQQQQQQRVERLRVMVQVNTSGEESKSGTQPGRETVELCRHVAANCPALRLAGLMTIGAIARSQATTAEETENEDFARLVQVRDEVVAALELAPGELELSMGMSADYEGAIAHGSDEVRIGSTIFGERPQKRSEPAGEQDKH